MLDGFHFFNENLKVSGFDLRMKIDIYHLR